LQFSNQLSEAKRSQLAVSAAALRTVTGSQVYGMGQLPGKYTAFRQFHFGSMIAYKPVCYLYF
jgi:hypothetical protein